MRARAGARRSWMWRNGRPALLTCALLLLPLLSGAQQAPGETPPRIVVLPFEENCCGGLGSPVGSRPLSLAASGLVDGFTSQAKLPFLSFTTMLLSRWSVIVWPSCEVGSSTVFVSRSV